MSSISNVNEISQNVPNLPPPEGALISSQELVNQQVQAIGLSAIENNSSSSSSSVLLDLARGYFNAEWAERSVSGLEARVAEIERERVQIEEENRSLLQLSNRLQSLTIDVCTESDIAIEALRLENNRLLPSNELLVERNERLSPQSDVYKFGVRVLKLIEFSRTIQIALIKSRYEAKDKSDTHSKLQFWSIAGITGTVGWFGGPLLGLLGLFVSQSVATETPSHRIEKECDQIVYASNEYIKQISERIDLLKEGLRQIGRATDISV